ncbi:MAE_28990/MAE_18760 family HEPN-like nuclease [Desulfonema magnum]|uniref:HEPN domain-containing protein n=1 Tax=Desulfonema magnum TaxID=45655 RepID=A0A975BGV8_9BACT|nr:HEPN domain-containing protein [Desulfonema magnum]
MKELRNNIAHGRNPPVSLKVYNDIHDEIISLMRNIKNEIINAAVLKSYKRTT